MRGADAMQENLFTVAKLDDFVPDDHRFVFRGVRRVDQQFKLTMTASNLMRMARMPVAVPYGVLR